MSRHVVALIVGVALATSTLGAAVGERHEPTAAASTISESASLSDWTVETGSLAVSAGLDADPADTDATDAATNPHEHHGHAALVSSTADNDAAEAEPDPAPNEEAEAEQAAASSFDPPPGGPSPTGALGIPERALEAYRAGAATYGARCSLGWEVLAGVGRAESGHANGGRLYADGTTWQPILGPVLDGGAFAAISDSDGGRYDGNDDWDRAVGPMQFLPGTWTWIGVDADGDGTADPHDIDDAAATAARYLCRQGGDLSDRDQLRSALLRYNASGAYADAVISWADGYAGRAIPVVGPAEPAPEPSPTPTDDPRADEDAGTADEPSTPSTPATADPTPTADATPTAEPTPSVEATATVDPRPAPRPAPTPSVEATPTVDPTPAPTPSVEPTPTPETTPSPDPGPTDDPIEPESTLTAEPTPSGEPTSSAQPTSSDP